MAESEHEMLKHYGDRNTTLFVEEPDASAADYKLIEVSKEQLDYELKEFDIMKRQLNQRIEYLEKPWEGFQKKMEDGDLKTIVNETVARRTIESLGGAQNI